MQAEVLIGAGAPLMGQMAWHGEDEERGIQMAVSEISAAGGFLGETVETVLPMIIAIPSKRSRPPTTDRRRRQGGHRPPLLRRGDPASKVYADAGVEEAAMSAAMVPRTLVAGLIVTAVGCGGTRT